jgi:hypothetical protein
MLHVFKGEILANMTQVSDVAPGPLVKILSVLVAQRAHTVQTMSSRSPETWGQSGYGTGRVGRRPTLLCKSIDIYYM